VVATNRPDLIDSTLLRPGRVDRHVEVGELDEAATIAVREYVHATAGGEDEDAAVEDIELTMDHFERALSAVESSGDEDQRSIEGMVEAV
jgi:transitional endoplasmic reticulum ATPase